MARERWLIDGYEITEGNVRDIEYRTGLYATAAFIGDNGMVPNRSGQVWRPKRRGPAGFTLNIWMGTETGRPAVDALYDDLIRAVGDGSRLPLWTRYLADGTVRETRAEVVGAMSPQALGNAAFRLALEVNVPSGIWESTVNESQSSAARPPTGNVVELTTFAKVTAPMERLSYQITGPAVDPKVTDMTVGTDGDWFQYYGTIPNNSTLTVNAENWALTSPTFEPDRAAFYHNGPRFMVLRTPKVGDNAKVMFEYANGGVNTRLTVSGRRAFAV